MQLERWILERSGLVLAAVALVTVLAAFTVYDPVERRSRLEIEPSIWSLLPEESPERSFLNQTQDRFGSSESLVMGFATGDVFTPDALRRVRAMRKAIHALPEVQGVTALDNAIHFFGNEWGLEIGPFVPGDVPESDEELATLREHVMVNPFTAGSLVARDGKATAFLVQLKPITTPDYGRQQVSERLLAAAREHAKPGEEVWLTGGPHMGVSNARILNARDGDPAGAHARRHVDRAALRVPHGAWCGDASPHRRRGRALVAGARGADGPRAERRHGVGCPRSLRRSGSRTRSTSSRPTTRGRRRPRAGARPKPWRT